MNLKMKGLMMPVDRLTSKNLGMLMLAALFVAFFFQGSRGLWEPDEGFYANVSGAMARSGDYIVPRVNGGIFLEKPPIVYWGMVAGLKLVGWNEWGLRSFHALSFSLTVLALALLGASHWSAATGLRAGYFYLLMILPFGAANILTPDMPLTLFVTAGLYCFWKGRQTGRDLWKVGFLAAYALAWMTKSTASIVWASAPVMFLLLSGNVKRFLKGWWLLSALPIAVAALFWYVEVGQRVPGALAYFWKDQVTGRMVSDYYQRNPGWKFAWYYLPVLFIGALPLSFFWPKWGRALWAKYRTGGLDLNSDPSRLFVLCWIVFPTLVLTLAQSRLVLYAMPVFGALALASARLGDGFDRSTGCRKALWVWVAFLLSFKVFSATYPYAQDDRAVWNALKTQCPVGKGTVVLTDGGLNGLGFYSDLPVRNVLWRGGYLYFDPPPKVFDFAMQVRQKDEWAVFVTDADKVDDLSAQLKPYGVVGSPRPLPGHHASVLLRFVPLKP